MPPTEPEANIHFVKQAHAMFLFLDDKFDVTDDSQRAAFKVFEWESSRWLPLARDRSECDAPRG